MAGVLLVVGIGYFTLMGGMAKSAPPDMLMAEAFPPADADEVGDGASSEIKTLVQQTMKQQDRMQDQQQQTETMLDEVNELRVLLIEKRFRRLDKLAKRKGWDRNRRIPKEGRRHWDEYQEWVYLKANLEDLKKPDPPKPETPVLKKLQKGAAPKPIKAAKKEYKPDWIME